MNTSSINTNNYLRIFMTLCCGLGSFINSINTSQVQTIDHVLSLLGTGVVARGKRQKTRHQSYNKWTGLLIYNDVPSFPLY